MAWFSILPDNLSVIETWTARLFLLLGLITIGPWAALIIYDVLLYVWRSIAYEIPFVGGRARGTARPRAPSLKERPDGHRRRFSLARSSTPPGNSAPRATGSYRNDQGDLSSRQHEHKVFADDED